VNLSETLDRAVSAIGDGLGTERPELAVVLGSGLGALAEAVEGARSVPYAEIPGFPVSTAPSHEGRFVAGRLFGRPAVLMQGRVHLYEGWSAREVALPVWLMRRLGAEVMVATNAAGALNPALTPGAPMAISDHVNLTGANPLIGANDEAVGPRFPDMSRAYDAALREAATAAAARIGEPGARLGFSAPAALVTISVFAPMRRISRTGSATSAALHPS
jgi:purine-nucleoside phosphorylase